MERELKEEERSLEIEGRIRRLKSDMERLREKEAQERGMEEERAMKLRAEVERTRKKVQEMKEWQKEVALERKGEGKRRKDGRRKNGADKVKKGTGETKA